MSVSGVQVAQFVGITAAMFVAGQNAAYSTSVIPSILAHPPSAPDDEKRLIVQWRRAYNIGFRLTPPPLILAGVSFGYLSYLSRPSPRLCALYAVAAILVPAILPVHTFAIMRPVLGALCLRAEKLAGPGEGTPAERLAKGEPATLRMEASTSTEELVRLFGWHNACRTVTGLVGALAGVWASLEHARMLGAGSVVAIFT